MKYSHRIYNKWVISLFSHYDSTTFYYLHRNSSREFLRESIFDDNLPDNVVIRKFTISCRLSRCPG